MEANGCIPKTPADDKHYRTLPTDSVVKQGAVILKAGSYEIRKREPSSSHGVGTAQSGSEQTQVIARKDRAHGEYVIPAGSKINVVLDGDLNSELQQSPVTAQLIEGFSFQGRNLLPAGTKALGHVNQAAESERIGIQFDQLVLPNGHQIGAQGYALMVDGSPGIVGEYHSGRFGKIAGAVGLSFLSGASAALQTTQANAFGYDQPENSTRNAILNGMARTTLDQGKNLAESAQNSKGYVTLSSGASFQLYFEKEVDLSGAVQ